MLCDGRIVCGCADPYGQRVLGDARDASVRDVWTGPIITALRADLNGGGSKFCGDCPLKLPLKKDEAPPVRPIDAGPLPVADVHRVHGRLQHLVHRGVLRAGNRHHADAPGRHARLRSVPPRRSTRSGPSLGRIDFFNYGEAFLHKRAVEMCEYIKANFPHIYLYTSTNGLALTEAQARRLVHSGIDEVTFSIDGATPESYAQVPAARPLRRRAREPAGDGRREARGRAATCRSSTGATSCSTGTTATRRWTLRAAAGRRDRRRSPVLGDHRPSGERVLAAVRARLAGARGDPPRDLGRQQPRQRHSRRDAAGAHRRAHAGARRCRCIAPRRPRRCSVRTRVHNLSTRPFPAQATYGRRLVRLGAQLCAADGTLINRDFARAWLPQTLGPGGTRRRRDRDSRRPAEPGRYALKFDLVSEGIDWFERCGSQTTTRSLWVR